MWKHNNTELYHHGVLGMKWGRHKQKVQERKNLNNRIIEARKQLTNQHKILLDKQKKYKDAYDKEYDKQIDYKGPTWKLHDRVNNSKSVKKILTDYETSKKKYSDLVVTANESTSYEKGKQATRTAITVIGGTMLTGLAVSGYLAGKAR